MDIWDWALAAYGWPGVPEACLALQDDHGQNTCLLLWAAWAGASEPELLRRAAETARAWEAAAVLPLRQARRAIKAPQPGIADDAREALRTEVKACELHAERVLLQALAGLGGTGGGTPALEALEAASAAWGPVAPRRVLADLAAALG